MFGRIMYIGGIIVAVVGILMMLNGLLIAEYRDMIDGMVVFLMGNWVVDHRKCFESHKVKDFIRI